MTRQDSIHDHGAARPLAAGALFARKGEAIPVGGRAAPRRVITMRPLSCEPQAPVTLPQPANTSLPVSPGSGETAWPDNVVPIAPTMGPVAAPAAIQELQPAGTRPARPTRASLAIRTPVRPLPVHKGAAAKRTTLRLDDTLRARLDRFGASETLSVQALLTRALERFLPAISIKRSGASSLRLPSAAPRVSASSSRSVRFDPHLYWRLKTAAAKRKRSMQSIMVAALATYLDGLERAGRTAGAGEVAPASGPAARPMLAVL